ncbi:MAG: hypothetical protein R2873_25525 [Caldilineaceae bacterium]
MVLPLARTGGRPRQPRGLGLLAHGLPLALLSGLLFALLADSRFAFADGAPYLLLLWSPLVAVLVYLFLMIENPSLSTAGVAGVGRG